MSRSDAAPAGFDIKGWCPGALRPMMSGDGLVVRVRAPMGRLSPAQMSGLADAAERHGNGLIDLSARANLQLRGVPAESHPALLDALRQLDLLDHDAATEARRNITVTPFWQDGDDTQQITTDLADLLARCDLPLPGKFGFAVDCGAQPVLRATSADIRIETVPGGVMVRADGSARGICVPRGQAAQTALDLAAWFTDSGGVSGGRGRMAAHLAHARLPGAFAADARPAASDTAHHPGATPFGTLLALPFGRTDAATLRGLADAPVQLTPWRMLLTRSAARPEGVIETADDPRLSVAACPGAPFCPQAHAATRDLAEALAPHAPAGLHVSGCAKGCAHPGPAPITLTAQPEGWAMILGGTAMDAPTRHLTDAQLRRTPQILTGEHDDSSL